MSKKKTAAAIPARRTAAKNAAAAPQRADVATAKGKSTTNNEARMERT